MTYRIRPQACEKYIADILTTHNLYPKPLAEADAEVEPEVEVEVEPEAEVEAEAETCFETSEATPSSTTKIPKPKPKKVKKTKPKPLTAMEKEKVQQEVPTTTCPDLIFSNKYRIDTLKRFMRMYKLKQCGSKQVLQNRLYAFLLLSPRLYKLQAHVRGTIVRNHLALHGPAVLKRSKCNNLSDFVTLEETATIPMDQFFSFEDDNGFMYGYNVLSLYALMEREGYQVKNPYNRKSIDAVTLNRFFELLRLHQRRNMLSPAVAFIPPPIHIVDAAAAARIEARARRAEALELKLEQVSDEEDRYRIHEIVEQFNSELYPIADLERILGDLDAIEQLQFLQELKDIWLFRSELTDEVKEELNPMGGLMFPRTRHLQYLVNRNTNIMPILLSTVEKVIWSAADTEWSHLSEYFIIGALTLASDEAETLVPWIHDAVRYMS